MLTCLTATREASAIPVRPLTSEGLAMWSRLQPTAVQTWLNALGFRADPGTVAFLPGAGGAPSAVLAGMEALDHVWSYAALPALLPAGHYRLEENLLWPDAEPGPLPRALASMAALGWALGSYGFTRYRTPAPEPVARPSLLWPDAADRGAVERTATAIALVRDLVNTPAADLGPAELAAVARSLAQAHGADCRVIEGEALLAAGYPLIHAVGRASPRAPRLIDLRWGDADHPRLTLVGKGVCFDSGGLDLKSGGAMLLMKKDMGGAAHALALAQMVMTAGLPARLRLLVPAVENVVAGNAFKPLDVLRSRKGLTVEVGNTDAEGRLILADALAEADSESPHLLLDFATLTGAARVALGPDLPALFSRHESLAAALQQAGEQVGDPVWRLPLWQGYRKMLDSKVADIHSTGTSPHAGAITAALFLDAFVRPETRWAHLDLMAWNAASRPGRPEGGEAMGLRAAFALVTQEFGSR